jgi:membrane-associated phospholipid phosphatase
VKTLRLPSWVDRADEAVDDAWEPLRGHRTTDAVFYAASTAADFSLLWHGLNVLRVLRGRGARSDLVRVALAIGIESVVVNQGAKRLFRRDRPHRDDRPSQRAVRQPSTSSFPSGHASSAVVATSLLSRNDPLAPLYRSIGAVVATSRLHVRVHHASDVVAGAALGSLLLPLLRRIVGLGR